MPGMNTGLNANNPTVVSAFKEALLHQGLVALLILAAAAVVWQLLRAAELARAGGGDTSNGAPAAGSALLLREAPARRLLRVAFGCMWVLDGILQAQPQMPLGMTTGVIEPAAASSPSWVQHVTNAGASIWSFHPTEASTAAVWIQVGIGLWLLVAPRGNWSRLAGAAAASWGLVVWVFGEAFGGIFAPGLTWLFGAPGAVLFYSMAAVLVALPERWWASPRLGRAILAVMGLFFVGMAVLQAWPGRGFWQGHLVNRTTAGTLAGMVQQMARTSQPHLLSSWVSAFGSFDMAHGFAVNLFVVVALGLLGLAFLTGRTPVLPYAVAACCVLCLADWVLIEDFGFFGGVGTDPNSMIPMLVVVMAGYLGVTKVPSHEEAVAHVARPRAALAPSERLTSWRQAVARHPSYLMPTIVALGAVGIVCLGAVPMAFASVNPTADPIIAEATDGTPVVTNYVAPNFRLVDQYGKPVSLAGLRGRTVALTFLDPVCVSDCPLIAQEFREADALLGPISRDVDLVAIDANPLYRARSYLDAFDRQEDLSRVPNWLYLTGSLSQLQATWKSLDVQVEYSSGGAMIAHSDIAYVIDRRGHVRSVLDADPGPGTEASQSSFAVTLANAIRASATSP